MSRNGAHLTNAQIDAAFANGEFDCVFQPKISLLNSKILGAEALVRWHHPELGEMPPSIFLSFLSQQGRMQELTARVFDRALAAAAQWHSQGQDWLVHVNLSADDLNFPGLAQALEIRLRHHQLAARFVRLELSEAQIGELSIMARERLVRLLEAGFSLALQGPSPKPFRDSDEFYVSEFQFRGTALLGLAEALSPTRSGRLLGMLRAAKRLDRETCAIGLDKITDLQTARALGFDAATGFSIARPMSLENFLKWASNREPVLIETDQAACKDS